MVKFAGQAFVEEKDFMQTVSPQFVLNKKVLLRYDIDVVLRLASLVIDSEACDLVAQTRRAQDKLVVGEDFKLTAGLETLRLCLKNAEQVILMGHIGRPLGKIVPVLSVKPICEWFAGQGFSAQLKKGKLRILENLRFDPGEEQCSSKYAEELASMGEVYINEAFASYRPASSTTVLPTLLPHAAGLRFAQEVGMLEKVRNKPKKPFVAIMGGAKVADKLPVIQMLAQKADAVLVGGKLVKEVKEQNLNLGSNVFVGMLNEDGLDIASQTMEAWSNLISKAATIIWNGPLGKFEDAKNDATQKIARMILDCQAEVVIGGGDTVAALGQYKLLQKAEKQAFVSVGGGAMLKFLVSGTLPTIEALQ